MVGTGGDGLHIMDRKTGKFTRYLYDPLHPEKLSRPPLATGKLAIWNAVTMITEDNTGAVWIGSLIEGVNRYDPVSKRITHYGHITQPNATKRDTISGFDEPTNNAPLSAITSKDGLLWMGTQDGNLYKINFSPSTITYNKISIDANSFCEQDDSLLWIATSHGVLLRNKKNGNSRKYVNEPGNNNSLSHDNVLALRKDSEGNLWIGTYGGLNKFNPHKRNFTRYKHDYKTSSGVAGDSIFCMHIDQANNLWMGLLGRGLDKMNIQTGKIIHYTHDDSDSSSLRNNNINSIAEDKNSNIWLGTEKGLDMLDEKTNKFHHYLRQSEILSVFVDASGIVWTGAVEGFYRFEASQNTFIKYNELNSPEKIKQVLDILEDDKNNLWLSSADKIIKINSTRNSVNIYGKSYGVQTNTFYVSDNYKAKNGEIFIGDQNGYYSFFPEQFRDGQPPLLIVTQFKLGDQEINPGDRSVLKDPIWESQQIKLKYTQNVFSFDFKAIDYIHPDGIRYLFMLENYDNNWHDLGSDHKAYFFNVPPGTYVFRVKAMNSEGRQDEKNITIIISPPWWRTWWAYTIFALVFIVVVWGFIQYRSRRLKKENLMLEEKVLQRTNELRRSLQELKSAQSQLIQSEKMASLGELTAGIAHEIQNPLNFVNNFSEVNKELIDEMKTEIDNRKSDEAKI